jgi:glycosyltransferase involved in cell wall biosynthesis
MRILITSDYLSTKPRLQDYQSQQLNLANALSGAGHEVLVLSGRRKGMDHDTSTLSNSKLSIKFLESYELPFLNKLYQMYIRGFINSINEFNPQLIICNEIHSIQSFKINRTLAKGVPTVLIQGRYSKSRNIGVNFFFSLYEWMYRFIGIRFKVLGKTHTAAAYIRQLFSVDAGVLPVGVSDDFKKMNEPQHWDFIFVGAFSDLKRPHMFIEIIQECSFLGWQGKALMVGTGAHKESIDEAIVERGLSDSVVVKNYVSNADMPRLYSQSKILVSLSKTEIFGMVYLEALASGCSVFCTSTAGSTDLAKSFEEVNVFPELEVKKLAKILVNKLDAFERVYPQVIESYRWNSIGNKIISITNEYS